MAPPLVPRAAFLYLGHTARGFLARREVLPTHLEEIATDST